ncbi:MAG: NADH-quinone oxidoreductase subunit C [Gemmatimonadetes bacterium]|nr:NADH-quinone oxidoreductase subunit C [Gemmatimonadota bacterium]
MSDDREDQGGVPPRREDDVPQPGKEDDPLRPEGSRVEGEDRPDQGAAEDVAMRRAAEGDAPSPLDAVEGGPYPTGDAGAVRFLQPDVTAARHPSVEALKERFPDAVVHHHVSAGDQHVVHVDPTRNLEVLGWLKDDEAQRYDLLADVTAVDFGGGRPIQVVYQLWSIPHRRGLRVKCELPLTALEIDSVEPLWKTANWLEREVYDLFGVEFGGHPDLRRILMPESYAEGHPLRKDFPLRGRFSRAEQTRRALSQDPQDHYIPEELAFGRPQTAEDTPEVRPELPDRGEDDPLKSSR